MSSRFDGRGPLRAAVVAAGLAAVVLIVAGAKRPALRVCADPNNLPFSNRHELGFENRIAALIARDLGERVEYYWWPQRRGFVRNTVGAGKCDLVIGVPADYGLLLTTPPYYRSTYVFVSRTDRHLRLRSLDDPRLRAWRIGLHFTGGKANPPAEHALARRGIIANIVPYSLYGNYAESDPPARLIDAVARKDVDVAIAWGPLAGYFAMHESAPLTIAPVTPAMDGPGIAFTFDIAMGVAPGDSVRRAAIALALEQERLPIERILRDYGVPLLPLGTARSGAAGGAAASASSGHES